MPASDASPPTGALSSTSTTPPNAITAKPIAGQLKYSPNSHAPIGTIRNGESAPINAAFATLFCVTPPKSTASVRPKNTPGSQTWRTSVRVTRRCVRHSSRFHRTLTATIRHIAISTPGVSARLTSVELSENPTTTPMTASTPSVLAFSRRAGVRRKQAEPLVPTGAP